MRGRLAGLLVAVAALGPAGCGGGADDADVKALLDAAFNRSIPSAVVTADVEIKVKGIRELGDPLRLQVSGPYRADGGNGLPAFDWDVSFSGGGQTVSGGLLSTGDNAFVDLQGTNYEVGKDAVRRFNRDLRAAGRQGQGRTLADFGVNPAGWLSEPADEGEENVAGVKTTHVKAKVDVGRMLDDLNRLVARSRDLVPGGGAAPTLSEAQQKKVEAVVGEPTLDVYVGKEDGVVRRLAATLELDVPKDARDEVGGVEGGSISFSVEFAQVGAPVQVSAPRSARPIAELEQQIRGLLGSGRGGRPFDRYSQCLDDADPSRIDEIEACARLLR